MQRDALRDLDDDIMADLAEAGLFDAATYQPPGTPAPPPVPCRVYVDREVQYVDRDAPGAVVGVGIEITILRREVAAPRAPGRITLTGTGETFVLRQPTEQDESLTVWEVAHAA